MKNEIRQGNYVIKKDDIMQLNEKELEALYLFKNWDRIEPIPLTEEWLLKFGYLQNKHNSACFYIQGHKIWKCNDLFMCDKNGVFLKSVHQLQNLYFALTNE